RAHCGDDDQSHWVGPIDFHTECPVYDLPFYESFDTDDPDTQKFCWEIIDANDDETTFDINDEQVNFAVPAFGGVDGFDDYLISPAVNVEGSKILSFKYRVQGSFFGPSGDFGLQVMMSTTDTDPDSFTEIEPLFIFENTDYVTKYVNIEADG